MKFIVTALIFLLTSSIFSQNNLQIFEGSFDSALIQAKIQNRNIFFITRSESCHVFKKFRTKIENDSNSYKFLNDEFIIFEYDMDHSNKAKDKRLKKYYHSWRGFPQIYFLDTNEKIITEIVYALKINQDEHLTIWKEYNSFNNTWKSIKKEKRKRKHDNDLDYDFTYKYILYRQIKNNSFEYLQIQNILTHYLSNIDTSELVMEHNWELIQKYGTLFSLNPKLIDIIARNEQAFKKNIGDSIVSEYLKDKYYCNLSGRKEKKIDKMATKYPYNTIEEAIEAIRIYKRNKVVQNIFN